MEVRPTGGEPSRVEVEPHRWTGNFMSPGTGQVVKLEFDTKNKKARFDSSDPNLSWKTDRQAAGNRSRVHESSKSSTTK